LSLTKAMPRPPARSQPQHRVPRPAKTAAGDWLPAADALRSLADEGLPVAAWAIAGTRADVVAAAERLGFPIVLKAERPGLVHKSEVGGVRLGLACGDAVAAAFDELAARLGAGPVLLQRQAAPGIELVIGAKRDASFGPVVMAGLGGIWVEALGDVALRLAPIGTDEALAMLDRLNAAPGL